MKREELKVILDKHLRWMRNEAGGSRADLYGADLSGANLYGADLSRADLSCANLYGANLYGANLSGADLSGADLSGANLYGADLSRADLSRANLSRANLSGADLSGADLSGANLYGANLYGANLSGADLYGANLSRANLSGANVPLELVNKFYPLACPEYGAFTAWKKCRDGLIVKLEVLDTAKRSSAYGRKCRCSAARVVSIENMDGTLADTAEAKSGRDSSFIYKTGEIVNVDDFDEDRRNECSTGIHFFITRQEAVDYIL